MSDNVGSEHVSRAYPMRYARVNDATLGRAVAYGIMKTTTNKQRDQEEDAQGKRIRQFRIAKGWSQAELGRRIGVGRAAISKVEKGDTQDMKYATFHRLAIELGTDTPYLRWGETRSPPGEPPKPAGTPSDTGTSGRFRVGHLRSRS